MSDETRTPEQTEQLRRVLARHGITVDQFDQAMAETIREHAQFNQDYYRQCAERIERALIERGQ